MRSLRSWPAIMLVCERERENANPYIECTLILRNTLKVASSCVAIEQDRGQKIGRKSPIETRTRRRTRRKWKCTMKTLRKLESIKSPVASILEVKHFRDHIETLGLQSMRRADMKNEWSFLHLAHEQPHRVFAASPRPTNPPK